jgi:hypothetical protein
VLGPGLVLRRVREIRERTCIKAHALRFSGSQQVGAMMRLMFIFTLIVSQVTNEKVAPSAQESLESVFERASREPNLDGAGLILSSLLSDESRIRSALLTSTVMDERTAYVLFGGHWGSRARATWKDGRQLQRTLVDSVSAKPPLIRPVIRADRYETSIRSRNPGGASTINYFPFFEYSTYADDLVERFIETLRRETNQPAKPVVSLDKFVLLTADEMEVNLLSIWQTLCGACDRLDLIDKVTAKTWRSRFPELDAWFQKNRPYLLWDNGKSCIQIDEDARESGRPTPRVSRLIPELKPPWASQP